MEFKKELAPVKNVGITEVFKDEPQFTNEFLTKPEEFAKILEAIGLKAEVEKVESQVQTSDGKLLDNIATTVNGDRVALEAQIGTSNMEHISKLPYYVVNLREDGEDMIAILLAEEFRQETIDYANFLNNNDDFDCYLVKAEFKEINGIVGFSPTLISPTLTTNSLKAWKEQKKSDSPRIPNNSLADSILDHLKDLGYNPTVKPPKDNGEIKLIFREGEYRIWIGVKTSGSIAFGFDSRPGRFIPHPNEEVFTNRKGYGRLTEMLSAKNLEDFKSGLDTLIKNL